MPEIVVAKDLEDLSRIAAGRFVALANAAIDSNGRFTVSLSGGSTPRSLYKLLASDDYRHKVDWHRVFIFFGDERFVLPSNAESNYGMAKESLLGLIDIPEENIFRWPTETGLPDEVAKDYEETLRSFFETESFVPRFDLILLGLGVDGHTASLFPGSPALKETRHLATANPVDKLGAHRLTFTFPLINNAKEMFFLVSGTEKAEVLGSILEPEKHKSNYPAAQVNPTNGKLIWLIDKPASSLLTAIHN